MTKDARSDPDGIVRLEVTVATLGSELARLATKPPSGAGMLSTTQAFSGAYPPGCAQNENRSTASSNGSKNTPEMRGTTVMVACPEFPPYEAVTVTIVVAVTSSAPTTVKLALRLPAGTNTELGTVAA